MLRQHRPGLRGFCIVLADLPWLIYEAFGLLPGPT
jgi:hypothetical protein